MQVQTLTSNSNNYCYLDRFDDIIKIALSLKANFYYADKETNKIYGFYEDGHSVIETGCPFPISNSVFFRGYGLPKEYINQYKTYFYRDDYPYLLLPENKRADMMNSNIGIRLPDMDISDPVLIDMMTGAEIDSGFISYPMEIWFRGRKYIDILNSFRQRQAICRYGIQYTDMQQNPSIINIMNSKVSFGSKLLVLDGYGKKYAMYIFKSLLGPITKADTLSITIYDDPTDMTRFLASFTVHKKKSKLDIPEISSMDITTYAYFINILMGG